MLEQPKQISLSLLVLPTYETDKKILFFSKKNNNFMHLRFQLLNRVNQQETFGFLTKKGDPQRLYAE